MSERNIMIIIGKQTFRQKTLVLSCKKKPMYLHFKKKLLYYDIMKLL